MDPKVLTEEKRKYLMDCIKKGCNLTFGFNKTEGKIQVDIKE